ncbi:MAG: hypothetical protein QW459_06035 [Sulfolobales archaeon]
MSTLLVDRKMLGELRNYEEMFLCISKVVLLGLERRFPGLYSLLKLKAVTKYGHLPDEIMLDNPASFMKLLEEVFDSRDLLEATLESILANITKKSRDLTKALMNEGETELYVNLANLYNSTLLKSCKKLFK